MNKRGFTLIELLVVITIIGILSAIVLVSLRGATNRAHDARIVSDMDQIRSTAEIYYGNNSNSYSNLCSDGDVTYLANDISNEGGANYECNANATSYCVEVELHNGDWWCVDSALRSKRYSSDPACDSSQSGTFSCE